jgi:hypothetical protein
MLAARPATEAVIRYHNGGRHNAIQWNSSTSSSRKWERKHCYGFTVRPVNHDCYVVVNATPLWKLCERWTRVAQMRLLRPFTEIIIINHTWNKGIHQTLDVDIQYPTLGSTGTGRMPRYRVPRTEEEYKPRGRRSQGRLGKSWKDQ